MYAHNKIIFALRGQGERGIVQLYKMWMVIKLILPTF